MFLLIGGYRDRTVKREWLGKVLRKLPTRPAGGATCTDTSAELGSPPSTSGSTSLCAPQQESTISTTAAADDGPHTATCKAAPASSASKHESAAKSEATAVHTTVAVDIIDAG